MKKMCVMLVIVIGFGLVGCKKSPPKPTAQDQPATKQAAPAAKHPPTTAAAEIDLTSSIDTLKEQAKQMSVDALKATAEKYKTQLSSTKSELTTKTDQLAKIPSTEKRSAEAQALTKEIMTLTKSWASLRERLAVYVDALKAKGVDTGSFKL